MFKLNDDLHASLGFLTTNAFSWPASRHQWNQVKMTIGENAWTWCLGSHTSKHFNACIAWWRVIFSLILKNVSTPNFSSMIKNGVLKWLELYIPISNLKSLCGMLDGGLWEWLIWTDEVHQVVLPCLPNEGKRIWGVHAIIDHQISRLLSEKIGMAFKQSHDHAWASLAQYMMVHDGTMGPNAMHDDGSETSIDAAKPH